MNNGLFSFVKNNIEILHVAQDLTTLKRAGNYWKGKCPFHHEKTGSFTVSPHKHIFYCFGCHVGGDVISLTMKMENCSSIEAIEYLIKKYQLTIPETYKDIHWQTVQKKQNSYHAIYDMIVAWCKAQLKLDQTSMNYLSQRGFQQNIIDQFSIGYFPPNSINKLLTHTQKNNFLADDLIEAKIISPHKSGLYSSFEGRIIFPIYDHFGQAVALGGRIIPNNDIANTKAKYYNSPETDYFAKGSILFGLDKAKNAIQEAGKAFLVEGYLDCLAMAQAGYRNTIATLGTACTLSHLKTVSRYTQQLYIIYDSDRAGQDAILRITELCWQVDIDLKVIRLPNGDDPASFFMHGHDLKPYINNAANIFDYYINSLSLSLSDSSTAQKINAIQKLLRIIKTIESPIAQDLLLQQASTTCNISITALKHELIRLDQKNSSKPDQILPTALAHHQAKAPTPVPMDLEKKIFCAIMNDITILKKHHADYLITYMPEPLRSLLNTLENHLATDQDAHVNNFFNILSDADQSFISQLLLSEESSQISPGQFNQLVIQLQKKHWKIIVRDIKKRISEAEKSKDQVKVATIMQDFLLLKKQLLEYHASSTTP